MTTHVTVLYETLPDVEDRMFDPFVTTKPPGEGTGLGLYISRNIIVQQHGGTLHVDSRPGRTCFEIRLPLFRKDATPGRPAE